MSQSPQNTCKMTAATKLLGEMCHLTAQSLTMMNTSEHFQVLKLLGEGSYGKVMLAVHRKRGGDHRKANMTLQLENPCKNNIILCLPGTPMALKFFSRESTSLYSFLKEYNFSLSFCSHPSLTSALGIAYFTPSHYIFAQQAGLFGDLYNVILPEIGMEEDCCQRVVSQLCSALSHLHSLGFVHRDLKPENVFLFDAACRWVKLGDYGMVKARGTRVPEVWYSSPYCTPEAEIARENRDNWNGSNDNNNDTKEDRGKQSKSRVWVFVEPSTDSWALGIITYAMLTGTHPWAQTSSDCLSYQKYIEWFQSSKGPVDETDVWAEPKQDVPGTIEAGYDKGGYAPVAPQFTCFTPLAHAFFHLLLDPSPQCRGHPEDVLRYLGGDWMTDVERARLEKERKKSKEKGTVKEMEG